MAMYTVSTSQLLMAALLAALIAAGSVVGYEQYKEHQALPEVQQTADTKCVRVINFKNGDAYNCEDVDVVLRQYKKVVISADEAKDEIPPKP
jgi:tRNA A58 N-methylase Trm61